MGVDELNFHVARSRDELERAFRLVYGTYLQAGYVDPDPSGIRFGSEWKVSPSVSTSRFPFRLLVR